MSEEYSEIIEKMAKDIEDLKQRLKRIQSPEMLEKLALLTHEQWSAWLRYMDNKAIHGQTTVEFTTGTWAEWLRKESFHYCDLTEKEKESDRKFARKVLECLKKEIGETEQK